MTAHDGRTVTQADLVGRRSLIFFGFTYCPDVCLTTLNEVALWLEELGEDGAIIDPYFVSVDPARDTPERMAEYVDYFSPRITGLVGSDGDLRRMAESYKVYYARVDLDDGDYLMDHSAAIYLMDSQGKFFDAITYTATFEEAVAKLRRLVDEG
ncbi:MAG: SCO family protein [Rhodospirillaceae bacterium]|nr:SCO family protein [Rhodospirillaceae bacterium]